MIEVTGGNENTYNPKCDHFDSDLGVCGHDDGELKACREKICPLK